MRIRACVVGGMNLDVTGVSKAALMPRDSNIGSVTFSPGGVGRNIAEQLVKLNAECSLFTCVSRDFAGALLEKDCAAKGIDLTYAKRSDARASCYLSIHEPDGDMALAVNDMALAEEITVPYLESVMDRIARADVCVLDANLSPECLAYLFDTVKAPITADPVSCAKMERLRPYVGRLSAFKPNAMEAMHFTKEKTPLDAARALREMGVRRAIVSIGAEGAAYCGDDGEGLIRPNKKFTCQTNGAGDAMCAGVSVGAALSESALGCARRGMRAAEALLLSRTVVE